MLIYTHCWELMNSVASHGSSSLPFVMKVVVCHFVSDSHEVMTALIVMLPLIVVVEISLQLHRSFLQAFISSTHVPDLHQDRPQLSSNLVKAYVNNAAMILTIRSAFCLLMERKS
jgi:hypothetical protein